MTETLKETWKVYATLSTLHWWQERTCTSSVAFVSCVHHKRAQIVVDNLHCNPSLLVDPSKWFVATVNQYVISYVTKLLGTFAMPNQTAETIVHLFVEEVIIMTSQRGDQTSFLCSFPFQLPHDRLQQISCYVHCSSTGVRSSLRAWR